MLERWPNALEALQAGLTASPVEAIDWGTIATGAPISLYFTDIRRDLQLRCQGGCAWERVQGKVYAKAYTVHKEEQQYNLYEGGVASSSCGGSGCSTTALAARRQRLHSAACSRAAA